MPKKDTDFSEADFKKEINKILKSMDIPLDPDGNYPEEVKELWPAIQSKLGKKLLAKNWRVWTTMWTNVIGPTYVSAAKEAAKAAGVKYRGEIGSFAKKYHRDHGLALCKTLTETDLQRVQDQIVDNWGIGEKAFEKKFQDDYIGSEARLKTIYRSEHARAISEGTLEVGQEVGHQYKQWWCAEDERSCEICMAHHEETVPMDEAFSGGYAIPQDSHPSCRCVLITLEESDLSDDQKARMASRDPISLDDLDPTFRNSPWKSNEAFRQVLNYKCPENSHGPGFSCGEEGSAKKSDIKSSNKDIHYIGFDVSLDFENISDKNSVFSDKIQQILKDEAYTIESLSGDERDVIKTYTLMGYSVNEYLYKHPQSTDQKYKGEIKTIETFDNIFKNNKLKNSIITFRGISKRTLNKDKDFYEALHVPGTEIKLKGYSSSSIMPFVAAQLANVDDGCILEMKLPKGSDALYIAKESTFPWEEEVLINRNTSIKIGSSRVERVMIEPGNFKDMEIISVELKPSISAKQKQNESIKLNYKCKSGTVDESNKCNTDSEDPTDEYTPEEHKKALEAEQFVKSKFSSEIEVGDCHFLDVSPSIPIYTKHFRAYIDINPDKLDNPTDVAKLSAIDNAEKLCTKYKLDLGEIHLVENRKHGIVGASDPLSDRIIISIGKDMLKDPEKVEQIAIIEEKMGIPYSTIDNNKPFDKVLNDVLVHEVAHNLLLEYEYDNNDFYKMSDKPISVYAMTNPHESFAENFVAKQNGQSLDDYNEQYIAKIMAWSKNKKETEDDE